MLYTTFQILVDSEENSGLIQRIEEIVGSRVVYGMNTPIPMQTLSNGIGLELASSAIVYSVDDPDEISKTIAIEWLRANQGVWNNTYPGLTHINDMLYFLEQYRLNTGSTEDPRVDYCGDPIPGSDANVFLAQINDLITVLNGIHDGLDPADYNPPVFETYFYNSSGSLDNLGAGWTVTVTNYTDPVGSSINDLPGYTTTAISELEENDALVGHDGFTYDPNNKRRFDRGVYTRPNQEQTLDQGKLAIRAYIEAVVLTAQWVIGETTAALATVYRLIDRSYRMYAEQQQLYLDPLLNRIREIAHLGLSPAITEIPEWQPYMDAIMNEELNLRAGLLRDPVFVNDYGDTDLSGFLTKAERINLEMEVNRRRQVARRDKAREIYTTLLAQYNAWDTFNPVNLVTIFDTYVV
jgi:hypothetical protein